MSVVKYKSASLIALAVAVLTTQATLAQDCKPEHEFTTITPGFLTIAQTTYVPHAYLDADGAPKGVDNDIAAEFAKMNCLTVTSAAVDPAAAIQSVLSGQADITVGDWYRTEERAKVLGLSEPLYLDNMALFSKTGVKEIAELEGKVVGTVTGYLYVADLQAMLGDSLKLYPNSPNMFQDLVAGRIDVAIDGATIGAVRSADGTLGDIQFFTPAPDKRVAASMAAGQAAFPYSKDNEALGVALDDAIAKMHANGMIANILEANGLLRDAANVGEASLLK